MNDAALASDLDEARFRAQLIAAKAEAAGYVDLALTAPIWLSLSAPWGRRPHRNTARRHAARCQ